MKTGTTPGGNTRFPGYDVLDQAPTWDPITRAVVVRRLGPHAPLRFFTVAEEAVCRPLLDRLLGQDGGPKVPLFELLDERLAHDETDGYRYDDMPPDAEAWRRSLPHLDEDAVAGAGAHFWDLDPPRQRRMLDAVRTADDWHGFPAARLWSLWLRYAVTAFYSHPWAWNEIGFGGPAYPRGFMRLGPVSTTEPFERRGATDEDPAEVVQEGPKHD